MAGHLLVDLTQRPIPYGTLTGDGVTAELTGYDGYARLNIVSGTDAEYNVEFTVSLGTTLPHGVVTAVTTVSNGSDVGVQSTATLAGTNMGDSVIRYEVRNSGVRVFVDGGLLATEAPLTGDPHAIAEIAYAVTAPAGQVQLKSIEYAGGASMTGSSETTIAFDDFLTPANFRAAEVSALGYGWETYIGTDADFTNGLTQGSGTVIQAAPGKAQFTMPADGFPPSGVNWMYMGAELSRPVAAMSLNVGEALYIDFAAVLSNFFDGGTDHSDTCVVVDFGESFTSNVNLTDAVARRILPPGSSSYSGTINYTVEIRHTGAVALKADGATIGSTTFAGVVPDFITVGAYKDNFGGSGTSTMTIDSITVSRGGWPRGAPYTPGVGPFWTDFVRTQADIGSNLTKNDTTTIPGTPGTPSTPGTPGSPAYDTTQTIIECGWNPVAGSIALGSYTSAVTGRGETLFTGGMGGYNANLVVQSQYSCAPRTIVTHHPAVPATPPVIGTAATLDQTIANAPAWNASAISLEGTPLPGGTMTSLYQASYFKVTVQDGQIGTRLSLVDGAGATGVVVLFEGTDISVNGSVVGSTATYGDTFYFTVQGTYFQLFGDVGGTITAIGSAVQIGAASWKLYAELFAPTDAVLNPSIAVGVGGVFATVDPTMPPTVADNFTGGYTQSYAFTSFTSSSGGFGVSSYIGWLYYGSPYARDSAVYGLFGWGTIAGNWLGWPNGSGSTTVAGRPYKPAGPGTFAMYTEFAAMKAGTVTEGAYLTTEPALLVGGTLRNVLTTEYPALLGGKLYAVADLRSATPSIEAFGGVRSVAFARLLTAGAVVGAVGRTGTLASADLTTRYALLLGGKPYGVGDLVAEPALAVGNNYDGPDSAFIGEYVGVDAPATAEHIVAVVITSTATVAVTMTTEALRDAQILTNLDPGDSFTGTSFYDVLISEIVRVLGIDTSKETVQFVWAVNLDNQASTRYTNFNFNSFARIGGTYYAAASDGLYSLGGQTDASAAIVSTVSLGRNDFNTQQIKRLEAAYATASSYGPLYLRVTDHDGTKYTYKARRHSSKMENQRFDVGRGLQASHMTLEIISNDAFELNGVSFMAVETTRRIR